jgi:hypothetical protein
MTPPFPAPQALEDSWKAAKKTGGANEEFVAADYLNRTLPTSRIAPGRMA